MSLNKDAKRLRDNYGVAYSTALRLIQKHGLDAAIELCAKTRGQEDEATEPVSAPPLSPEERAERAWEAIPELEQIKLAGPSWKAGYLARDKEKP